MSWEGKGGGLLDGELGWGGAKSERPNPVSVPGHNSGWIEKKPELNYTNIIFLAISRKIKSNDANFPYQAV